MCCWSISSHQERLSRTPINAMSGYNNSNMGHVCGTSDFCAPNSTKVVKRFCLNGACCIIGDDEYCSCDYGYTGIRCNEVSHQASSQNNRMLLDAVAITSIVFIVTMITVLIAITALLIWARFKRRQRQLKDSELALRSAFQDDGSQQQQPGLSWRQVTYKKQVSKSLSSSCSALNSPTQTQLSPMLTQATQTNGLSAADVNHSNGTAVNAGIRTSAENNMLPEVS